MSIELLIPVVNHTLEDSEEIPTVNARNLHEWLEVQTPFSMWIQRRVEDYELSQDVDFVVFNNFVNDESAFGGKRKVIDYFIPLDIAKELSMIEKTAKGKQARRYFIACEKQLRSNPDCLAQNQALKQELLKANPKWRKILYCYRLGLSQRNTAKILGVTHECVWGHLARMKTCGLIKATRATPLHLPLLTD
jgi:anti-repressor protein